MEQIEINVINKIASPADPNFVVCENIDYVIHFNFDEEWEGREAKTARFIWNNAYTDVPFIGDTVAVPVINNTTYLAVGVYSGDIYSSTPASIACKKSILSGENPIHPEPPEDVYNQIMTLINELAVDKADVDYVDEEIARVEGEIPSIEGLASVEYVDTGLATKGDNLTYSDNHLKLMSGDTELSDVYITGGGGGSTDYNDLNNKPKINGVELRGNKSTSELGINVPTRTSQLTNDSGFITTSALTPYRTSANQDLIDATKADTEDLSDVAFSGSYNDLTDKPTIPSALADLSTDTTHRVVTDTEKSTWNNKQEVISDIATIRNGAGLGATAVQPNAIADMATKTWVGTQDYATNERVDSVEDAIPSALSELTDDSTHRLVTDTEKNGWSAKADISDIPDVIDNVTSTSTEDALSAKQGKILNDRINNIEGRGRYLSHWNCVTGLPLTNPSGTPYTYRTGDFFIVNTVGTTNYIPNGSEYTGVPSTTIYSGDIKANDTIYYDGTNWSVIDTPIPASEVQDVYQNGESVLSSGIAYVVVPTAVSDLDNDEGYITGIDSTDVTDALGYTPYNATNPSGYQTSAQVESAITSKGYTTMSAVEAKGYAVASDLADVATSGSYNDLSNKVFDSVDSTTMQVVNSVLSVKTTNEATSGNYQPITSHGVKVILGDIEALLAEV